MGCYKGKVGWRKIVCERRKKMQKGRVEKKKKKKPEHSKKKRRKERKGEKNPTRSSDMKDCTVLIKISTWSS